MVTSGQIVYIPEELDLRENNPYSIGSVFQFKEGDYLMDRMPIEVEKSTKDRYFTVVQGDTLGALADKAYGNSKYWWILDDVNNLNLKGIEAMFELQPGITLYVPDLNKIRVTSIQ